VSSRSQPELRPLLEEFGADQLGPRTFGLPVTANLLTGLPDTTVHRNRNHYREESLVYEPVPIRTYERLLHHAALFVMHATPAVLRWIWRTDAITKLVALPFLIFFIEYAAQHLGLHGVHRSGLTTGVEVLLAMFVLVAAAFGGPRKR
jgi:hypothetical protein